MHSVITIVNKRESVFWQQSLNMVLRCATITNRNNALKTWVDRMNDREREKKKRDFSLQLFQKFVSFSRSLSFFLSHLQEKPLVFPFLTIALVLIILIMVTLA